MGGRGVPGRGVPAGPQSRAKVARRLWGEARQGILISDRWSACHWIPTEQRQLCWAHLLRHFKGFADYGEEARRIGIDLLTCGKRMFDDWHRVRDGTLRRADFQHLMAPLSGELVELLRAGGRCDAPKVAGRCREILKLEGALFTFVRVAGVEPTNNSAERAIRPAVLWRKGSFGTDSEAGSRFVERILTGGDDPAAAAAPRPGLGDERVPGASQRPARPVPAAAVS